MAEPEREAEPIVAQASPAEWRRFLAGLLRSGQNRLAATGLTLVGGFLAGFLALLLFAELAEDVLDQETQQLDNAVTAALRSVQTPALDQAARIISMFGSELVAVAILVLLVVLGWQRRWGAAVALLLTVGGAQLLNNVLKELFQRTRPAPVESFLIPAQAFSFPSGHAMVAAAFYLYLGYLAWRVLRGRLRVLCLTICLLLVLLIGLARIYLGVHYLTDVLAGYMAGFIWTDTVIIGGQVLGKGRQRPARVAQPDRSAPTETTRAST